MSKFWKVTAVAMIAAIGLVCAPGAMAKEKKEGDAAGAKAKPAAHQCTGAIVSISADCIVVKAKSGEQKFEVNAKTKFGSKANPKSASDFKAGDKVRVSFKEDGDKKVALSIGAPAAPKKEQK